MYLLSCDDKCEKCESMKETAGLCKGEKYVYSQHMLVNQLLAAASLEEESGEIGCAAYSL